MEPRTSEQFATRFATAVAPSAGGSARAACRLPGRTLVAIALAISSAGFTGTASADESAPAILQFYEARWQTMENRSADIFMAGYGSVWTPPTGRADSGGFSVGYDVYDRFDLGRPGDTTLYGTESSLKYAIDGVQKWGGSVYVDLVWNHNGFSDSARPGFEQAGAYPGFVLNWPGTSDGDFHSGFASGVNEGRLSGLIDIDHERDIRLIRNPVPGFANNIPAGVPTFGNRTANVPDENNRRFYPDTSGPFDEYWDPALGEDVRIYRFNNDNPMAGDPVEENALGYLMRNAQWMVEHVGVDGFRLDAPKHFEPWVLSYLDRAVTGASNRTLLDGSDRRVFSFGEVLDGDMGLLQAYTRKQGFVPGQVTGNRDALDFPLHFALKNNLSSNGLQNDWNGILNASFDVNDDGLANNGSQGVAFDASHDDNGAHLGNVANAYLAMRPGNWVVYFNAEEFGTGRDFPRDGRGDALGGQYGDAITTLVNLRNTHGRGDFIPRLVEKETLAYERENSALVVLSNRLDGGFDSRTAQTGFAPGTYLIEMTGNASADADIPELLQVNPDGTVNFRARRNGGTGNGYLVYGLATPQGELSLSNIDFVLAGGTPTPQTNGTTRLADIDVVTADTFDVSLQLSEVNLLGQFRDPDADGDNAVLRFNEGLDLNGNGGVDYVTPGSVVYGFEQFGTKSSPLTSGGDGQFVQTVTTDQLDEGMNYLEVRAFRRRTDGGPAVYSSFRRAVYVDRLPPESEVAGTTAFSENGRDVQIRSVDGTGDSVHVFQNLPAAMDDGQVLAMVSGGNRAGRLDRDLWQYGFNGVPSGNNAYTVVTYEITGNVNVQRFGGVLASTGIGAGLGDTNFNGIYEAADVNELEGELWRRNATFNPAADINGDGLIDNNDLWSLPATLAAAGAGTGVLQEASNAVRRRGDLNFDGFTNAADIDLLFASFGSTDWLFDLDADGGLLSNSPADRDDVVVLVETVLGTAFGDATLDGLVNLADFNVLAANFGSTGAGWAGGDFNGDGLVDLMDFNVLAANFGFNTATPVNMADLWAAASAASVPEPTTALLLPAAATVLLRRRRNQDN